jgi:hypothetical protein
MKTLQMIPPGPGCCPVCAAAAHGDEMPHNRDSLYYQWWFSVTNDRAPTWADAALRCSDATKARLKQHLIDYRVPPEKIGDL